MGKAKPRYKVFVRYRDGKDVMNRPKEEILKINLSHLSPGHPDYNPGGQTASSSGSVSMDFVNKLIDERSKKREGGRSRKGQTTEGGNKTRAAIECAEKELLKEGKRATNAAIAARIFRSPDHVRKLRKRWAKS